MANTRSKRTNIEMFLRHHWEQAESDMERLTGFVACLLVHVQDDDNELRQLRERLKVRKLFDRLQELPRQLDEVLTMLEKDPQDQTY